MEVLLNERQERLEVQEALVFRLKGHYDGLSDKTC